MSCEQCAFNGLRSGEDGSGFCNFSYDNKGGNAEYVAAANPKCMIEILDELEVDQPEWAEAGSAGGDSFKNLARSAVSSLARLVDGDDRDRTLESAANLLAKIHQAT